MQAEAGTASDYWQGSSFSSSQRSATQLNRDEAARNRSPHYLSVFISSGPNPRFFLLGFAHATGVFWTVSPSAYPNRPFLKVRGSGVASPCASSANGGSRLVCGWFGMACLVSLLAYTFLEVTDLVIAALPYDFSANGRSGLTCGCFGGAM
jgi:hypothetical protein